MTVKNKNTILYLEEAETLHKKHPDTRKFLISARNYIVTHAANETQKYKAKSIIESRFTPAIIAFEKGMLSCGAITNILTSMLRHVGYRVKLVHGEIPESIDHAWLSVYNKKNKKWEEFDLIKKNGKITSKHKKKLECQDWEDIRNQIEKDHRNYKKRTTEFA